MPKRRLCIQMSGAPGSGKSTTAKALAGPLDAVILDLDVIKTSLLDKNVPFQQAATLSYSILWALSGDVLKQGRNLIIDCTCNYEEVINRGRALAAESGFEYWYVECRPEVDIRVLDERLRSRQSMRSQRTGVERPPVDAAVSQDARQQESLFRRWIESPYRPKNNVIIVDSSQSCELCRDQIMEAMETKWHESRYEG
ncbi:Putative P-loop containing nucleoside triphosphate hydrolase [Colletotrichum destructivum]|uniref:P-loop containing nucleoside triphosphate hydrolase n=1 Tax=Colletotrichum destructivum TaxID=34406 RepID=A0AAX4I6L1_9PEZI|nr:Putative P-loop containing nucleoside triphosphate hydrolase [Colletotrichum destructivum]